MTHVAAETHDSSRAKRPDAARTAFDWDDAKRRLRQLAESLDPARGDSAEQARQILDRRARELAVPLESEADETEAIEILTFRMGDELYAVATKLVLELTRVTTLTQVPDCPPFVRGITNLRGDVLAIIDLCSLFAVPGTPPVSGEDDQPWMLVLGDDRAEFGIVIDEAVEVRAINTSDIFPTPVSLPSVQRDLLRGVTEDAMLVLDGAALLADQRLVIDET